MKGHEKRGAPRVPYISEVVCEGAGKHLTARTSDISASGVFIHSSACCEAGSILKLKFSISSTQIEAVGEVCYSIPHIGMGVRFLDLKPEHHAVIETLIESQQGSGKCERVKTQGLIPSGVEPVDTILGGVERGHLYLTHGDASGKSLFGIEFIVEGLRRGQPAVLVTRNRREDAVRRFARLGYDCLEDIRSGALVLFTYSYDIVQQIHRLPHLEPLMRELGPILDESSAERIVFDPVDHLLAGANQDDVSALANELAVWVRSFGATVVLVANDEDRRVIERLTPTVRESFRFEVRETLDRVVRFIVFEKSSHIPDQAVRVDPSRGISVLEDQQHNRRSNESLDAPSTQVEAGIRNVEEEAPTGEAQTLDPEKDDQRDCRDSSSQAPNPMDRDWTEAASNAAVDSSLTVQSEGRDLNADIHLNPMGKESVDRAAAAPEQACDAFFAMLDELQSFASSLDPDMAEI